jgi:hypothetical protein
MYTLFGILCLPICALRHVCFLASGASTALLLFTTPAMHLFFKQFKNVFILPQVNGGYRPGLHT